MQITHIVESDTLLTYSLATTPVPIQVSPRSGPPAIATLTFVLSAPVAVGTVTVQQIAFALPIGNPAAPDSGDLTENANSIAPSVSSSGPDKWTIAPGAAPGAFVLRPTAGSSGEIGAQGLAVVLTGIEVSQIVGTTRLRIAETARSAQSPSQLRTAIIAAPKFPSGFTAGNFAAETPLVPNGGTAVLTWTGSTEAVYTILWSTHSQVVTNMRRWISPPLTDVTTFILQVSAQQGGQTVELKFSTTVVVANPSVVANDLTVLTTSELKGKVNAQSLSVKDPMQVASLLVSNQLNVKGNVSLFTQAIEIKQGGHHAYTDGLVIGRIASSVGDPKWKCWGAITGSSPLINVTAMGGHYVLWMKSGSEFQMAQLSNSFVLPVPKDSDFYVHADFWAGNEVKPAVGFTWIPFGNPKPGQPTLKRVAVAVPPKLKAATLLPAPALAGSPAAVAIANSPRPWTPKGSKPRRAKKTVASKTRTPAKRKRR